VSRLTKLASLADGKPVILILHIATKLMRFTRVLVRNKNLMIMTGTGSGKTESFLLPILGKLAIEANTTPARFEEFSAVRAIVLYPMNALVNDQLGRLRLLFGKRARYLDVRRVGEPTSAVRALHQPYALRWCPHTYQGQQSAHLPWVISSLR